MFLMIFIFDILYFLFVHFLGGGLFLVVDDKWDMAMFCAETIHIRDKDALHRCATCMGYINAIHRCDPESIQRCAT